MTGEINTKLNTSRNSMTDESGNSTYNGIGYRVGQTVGDLDLSPTKQIDDVLDLTRQFNNLLHRSEDGIATDYIWDANLLSATTQGREHRGYLLDELGSPARLLLDGETAESFVYDEFGNTYIEPNPAQPFGFTGYMHDPIAGTWFAQAREYDAHTGRFTAKDTHWHPGNMIWGDAGTYSKLDSPMRGFTPDPMAIGQSGNLYAYTLNNPVNSVDLTGRFITFPRLRNAIFDAVATTVAQTFNNVVIEGARIVTEVADVFEQIRYQLQNYNDNPEYVFDRPISNYRGQVTIRHSIIHSAASVGPFILMNYNSWEDDEYGRRMLSHEHGHFLENQRLGSARYFLGIGFPSIINAGRGSSNLPMPYFRQPWEIHADLLAGLIGQRSDTDCGEPQHTAEALLMGLAYFAHLQSIQGTDWFRFLRVDLHSFTNHDFSSLKEGG